MVARNMPFLDFYPQILPPQALPTCAWSNHTLWENKITSMEPLNLSALSFDKALKSIFDKLTFCELCEVVQSLEKHNIKSPYEALFACYQFRYDAKLEKTIRLYLSLSDKFKIWARAHDLSPKDLYPLCALTITQDIKLQIDSLIALKPTRSQGAQALELISECLLLEKSTAALLQKASTAAEALTLLHSLRYPQAETRDSIRQKTLLSGWTKMFHTRWLRQGDRSGVEVKFFVGSKKELSEKISTLSRIHDGWSDDEH